MGAGKNLRTIGKQNIHNVIKLLIMEKSLSRKELSDRLGLTKMTVGNIVNHLKEEGYVTETRDTGENHTIGPKPTAITIVPKRILAVGVHISSTKITTMLIDIVDGILIQKEESVDNLESNQQLASVIKQMVGDLLSDSNDLDLYVVAIGVTFDGAVDLKTGKITVSMDRLEKEVIAIKSILEKKFRLPTIVGNDIEGASIAELIYGANRGPVGTYYLNMGETIRGAYITDYTILYGDTSRCGEVGHMSVKYDGPLCLCGSRGCYHLYASTELLLKNSNSHSIDEINLKLQDRDPLVLRTLEDFIQISSVVFSNIVHLYSPNYILVGGELAKLDYAIYKKIERLLNERILFKRERYVKVVISDVKTKANTMGAALIILRELFT
ncbi:MAG: ROK family transcriptional regulator [bacterium]|nr:ROK family transcriptional regulator [bacterium]